jgi:hypothetical protein
MVLVASSPNLPFHWLPHFILCFEWWFASLATNANPAGLPLVFLDYLWQQIAWKNYTYKILGKLGPSFPGHSSDQPFHFIGQKTEPLCI